MSTEPGWTFEAEYRDADGNIVHRSTTPADGSRRLHIEVILGDDPLYASFTDPEELAYLLLSAWDEYSAPKFKAYWMIPAEITDAD